MLLGSLVDGALDSIDFRHVKCLLPSVWVARAQVFIQQSMELLFVQFYYGNITVGSIGGSSRIFALLVHHASLVVLHGDFKLFKICEGKESLHHRRIFLLKPLQVGWIFEAGVECFDLGLCIVLLQFGFNDMIEDVDILFKNSGVLELVLVDSEIKLVLVLLKELELSRGEVWLCDHLSDGLEYVHILCSVHNKNY